MAISLECNVRSLYLLHFPQNNDNDKPFPFHFPPSFGMQLLVLVNEWMWQTYAFLDDDRAIVTRLPSLLVDIHIRLTTRF
jgi:hypothetical protein